MKNQHGVTIKVIGRDDTLELPSAQKSSKIVFKGKDGTREELKLNNDLETIGWLPKTKAAAMWKKGNKVNGWFTLCNNKGYLTAAANTNNRLFLSGMY